MKVFISHNKADKTSARALAVLLVERGEDVWFDEWDIRPGESIIGGMEEGLTAADVFILFWSRSASESNWVGAEVRTFLRRRVENEGLRIVPLMVDGTALPALVAEYRGFDLSAGCTLDEVAVELTGNPRDVELARRLQERLLDLTGGLAASGDPFPYLVCPNCAHTELRRREEVDHSRDDIYYTISCEKCGWGEWTQ